MSGLQTFELLLTPASMHNEMYLHKRCRYYRDVYDATYLMGTLNISSLRPHPKTVVVGGRECIGPEKRKSS